MVSTKPGQPGGWRWLQQQPLTLQAISLPGTGTVSADITPPVVALDDVLTNDSTPALTGTVNDPTATVVVNVDGVDYPAVNNGDGTWTLADNTLPALTMVHTPLP